MTLEKGGINSWWMRKSKKSELEENILRNVQKLIWFLVLGHVLFEIGIDSPLCLILLLREETVPKRLWPIRLAFRNIHSLSCSTTVGKMYSLDAWLGALPCDCFDLWNISGYDVLRVCAIWPALFHSCHHHKNMPGLALWSPSFPAKLPSHPQPTEAYPQLTCRCVT